MITVLMATYNGSLYIEKQLESIRNQDVKIDRVVIVDDCSTDETYQFLLDYTVRHSLPHWEIYQNSSNIGHYKTFIDLASKVTEGVVFFSDQDDIWDLNKVSTMLKPFLSPAVSMVFCESRIINESGVVTRIPEVSNETFEYPMQDILKKWPSGYQTAYRAEVLKEIIRDKSYNNRHFQFHDVLFAMLSPFFGKIIKIDRVLDSHRVHKSNVTFSINSVSFHNTLDSRLDYYDKMLGRYEFVCDRAKKCNRFDLLEISKHFITLYDARKNFIISRKWSYFIIMLKEYRYYNGKRALMSDIIYSLRLNTFFNKIF